MDLNAEVDQLVRQSQTWIPWIMEYGSRVLLAVITLAIGWWLINKVTQKLGGLLALRNADLALQALGGDHVALLRFNATAGGIEFSVDYVCTDADEKLRRAYSTSCGPFKLNSF